MGLFDGLRSALRKDSAGNAGRAQRTVDSIEGSASGGLRQMSRVSPGGGDDNDAAAAKPKKQRSKDFLEMTPEEKKAWLAHPTE